MYEDSAEADLGLAEGFLGVICNGKYRDSFQLAALRNGERKIPRTDENCQQVCKDTVLGDEVSNPEQPVAWDPTDAAHGADSPKVTTAPADPFHGHINVTHPAPPPKVWRYSEIPDPDTLPPNAVMRSPSGNALSVEEFRNHPGRPKCIRERQEIIMRSVSRLALAENGTSPPQDPSMEIMKVEAGQHIDDIELVKLASPNPAVRVDSSTLLRGGGPGVSKRVDPRGVPYGNETGCRYVAQNNYEQEFVYDDHFTNNKCCNFFCGWESPLLNFE